MENQDHSKCSSPLPTPRRFINVPQPSHESPFHNPEQSSAQSPRHIRVVHPESPLAIPVSTSAVDGSPTAYSPQRSIPDSLPGHTASLDFRAISDCGAGTGDVAIDMATGSDAEGVDFSYQEVQDGAPSSHNHDPETGLSGCLWRTTSKKSASNDTGKARNGNPTKRLIKEKEKMAKRAWRKVVLPNRDRPFPFGPQYTMALQGKGHIQVAIEHRGHRRRIVRYKEASLYEWGFFRGWKGTLFENKFIWEQLLLLTALASLIGSITYFSATEEWAKRVDVSGVSSISLSMNTLVSFVVSLYLRKAIIIWWDSIHQEFYRLWNIAENLCMRTAIYFPTTSNLDTESRQLVFRYCLLSIALFFKDARETDAWDKQGRHDRGVDTVADLIQDGLCTQKEAGLISTLGARQGRSQMVWVWVASLFTRWGLEEHPSGFPLAFRYIYKYSDRARTGRLPDPTKIQERVLSECTEARGVIGKLLNQLNTQLPFPYAHTIVLIIKIFIFIIALQAGFIGGITMRTQQYEWLAIQIIQLVVTPFFYQGLLFVKAKTWNAFGLDDINISYDVTFARMANECSALFEGAIQPPYVDGEEWVAPARLPGQLLERQIPGYLAHKLMPHSN